MDRGFVNIKSLFQWPGSPKSVFSKLLKPALASLGRRGRLRVRARVAGRELVRAGGLPGPARVLWPAGVLRGPCGWLERRRRAGCGSG